MPTVINGSTGIDKVADGADMPAGSVLQVVTSTLPYVLSTSSTYSVLGSVSVTPKSSSSFMVIDMTNHVYISSTATDVWRGGLIRLKRDSTVIQDDGIYGESSWFAGDDDRYMTYSTRHYVDVNGAADLTSRTYSVEGVSKAGVVSVHFNNTSYCAPGRITVTEVEA